MFNNPIKNLTALGLRENDIVADLGAGTGYYSLLAGALVPKGKVYAVEVDKNYLSTIEQKARDARLTNIEIIWGNIEKIRGTKIGDGMADAVIVSNVLFQLEDRETCILEIKRILKPEGKVLFVDWREDSPMRKASAVPKDEALLLFEKKGFAKEREIDAGDHHYGMIFNKVAN